MSTTLTEHTPLISAHCESDEPDSLFHAVLSLHTRMLITRRRLCHLVEKGLLSGQCTRYRGTLYTDASRRERIPINHTMYYSLHNANLIDEKSELLNGVIVGKVRQTHRNAYTRSLVDKWLMGVFDFRLIQNRAPIDISAGNGAISETEPAITVMNQDICSYIVSAPPARDILLLIEIADSNLRRDGIIKRKLYANAEIQDYWIVQVSTRTIIVHREPENGQYNSVVTYTAEQEISCLAKPEELKRVDELIAPMITETT